MKIKIIHNPYENNLQINNSFFFIFITESNVLYNAHLQRNKTFTNFTVLSFFMDYLDLPALSPATSAYYAGRASATRLCAVAKFWALFIENTRHRKNSPLNCFSINKQWRNFGPGSPWPKFVRGPRASAESARPLGGYAGMSRGKFWNLESLKCHYLHFAGRFYRIMMVRKWHISCQNLQLI